MLLLRLLLLIVPALAYVNVHDVTIEPQHEQYDFKTLSAIITILLAFWYFVELFAT